MKNYIKILLIVIFFSSCALLKNKKYNPTKLQEIYFNYDLFNKNYVGMTREQIIYIFGRPIISDSFSDVYHYILYVKKNNILQKKILNLYFKKNKVLNFNIE